MLALKVNGFDGLHQWALEEVSDPLPSPGEVQVRVAANAISYVDLLFARGGYQVRPPLPLVPGTEFSGVVTALGDGVRGITVGQAVTGMTVGGSWAELTCVPATSVAPLAAGCDLRGASALAVTYATAVYALEQRGALRAGEAVLVLGATGGVGVASIQVAKAMGATVIAGVSGQDKRALALEEGADHAIDISQADWRAAVKAVAPQGIDVVVDPVGDRFTETALRTLRWGGRHLIVGFAGGEIPAIRTNLPLLKGAALVGVDIRQLRELDLEGACRNMARTVHLFAEGKLHPRIAHSYSFKDWLQAIVLAQDRSTVGRVILDWSTTS